MHGVPVVGVDQLATAGLVMRRRVGAMALPVRLAGRPPNRRPRGPRASSDSAGERSRALALTSARALSGLSVSPYDVIGANAITEYAIASSRPGFAYPCL